MYGGVGDGADDHVLLDDHVLDIDVLSELMTISTRRSSP